MFRAESCLVSNNIKFQIFQNVQLFSINRIKCPNAYADSYTTNFIKTALIFDCQYTVCQCQMLKNYWNTLKISLSGQNTKQP